MNEIKVHFLETGQQATFATLALAEHAIAENSGGPAGFTFERSSVAKDCRVVRSPAGKALALLNGLSEQERFVIHTGILVHTGNSAGEVISRATFGEAMEYIAQIWRRNSDAFYLEPADKKNDRVFVWLDRPSFLLGRLPVANIFRKLDL